MRWSSSLPLHTPLFATRSGIDGFNRFPRALGGVSPGRDPRAGPERGYIRKSRPHRRPKWTRSTDFAVFCGAASAFSQVAISPAARNAVTSANPVRVAVESGRNLRTSPFSEGPRRRLPRSRFLPQLETRLHPQIPSTSRSKVDEIDGLRRFPKRRGGVCPGRDQRVGSKRGYSRKSCPHRRPKWTGSTDATACLPVFASGPQAVRLLWRRVLLAAGLR